MQYSDLTLDQQAQAQSFMDAVRPIMGDVGRVFMRLQHIQDAWTGGVSAIFALLDAGAPIGASSGLVGAQVVTKDSVISSMNDFVQAIGLFNNDGNRQRYIAFAGLQNTMPG